MITRLYTVITGPRNDGSSWSIDVQEDWDAVFNKIFPVTPTSSTLEARQNLWYTKTDGGRVAISPQNIYAFEEVTEEE